MIQRIKKGMVAPPLVCANCGESPSDHRVVKERLTCLNGGGGEFAYTKERRVWDILVQLDDLDRRTEQLRDELFVLTEDELYARAS
jgi:hypothetical protein